MNGPGHQDPISMRRERKLGARLQTAAPETPRSPRPAIQAPRAPALRTVGSVVAKARDGGTSQTCDTETAGDAARISPPTTVLATSHADTQKTTAKMARSLLTLADRTARISMDAVLILLFSPVIAFWWLNERRKRKSNG